MMCVNATFNAEVVFRAVSIKRVESQHVFAL